MDEFDKLQQMAIPPASENKAGEKFGTPGTPTTSRDRLMKKAGIGGDVNFAPKGHSPHAAPVNPDALARNGGGNPDDDDPVNPQMLNTTGVAEQGTASGYQHFDPMSPFADEGMEARAELAAHGMTYEDLAPSDAPGMRFPGTPRTPVDVPFNDPSMLSRKVQYVEKPCPRCEFLKNEEMVTFELNDGMFSVPCIDVRTSSMSVAVLVPTKGMGFVPKAGTKLKVSHCGSEWSCFYPGTYVSYDELGFSILHFLREDTD